MSEPAEFSFAAKLYVVAAIVLSVGMVAFGWHARPIVLGQLPTLIYLAVGTQIAGLLPIRWTKGVQTVQDPLLIATGLFAPGAGVGLVAWLATFDRRVPGRDTTWWAFVFNRAMHGIAHVIPSLAASMIEPTAWWALPVQTGFYVVSSVAINYLMAARYISLAERTAFWATLAQNVGGFFTLASTAMLGFSGGILFLLLETPHQIGYLMAPGLFGFVLAVRRNVELAQRQTELKEEALALAAGALDARDHYTEGHSTQVAIWAAQLGDKLDLGERECEQLRIAGSLHDIGKIGVPDHILNKPGPLNDDEWAAVKRHPDIGADMIARYSQLAEVAPVVRHHHERWDGSGYPAGLKGDAIPYGARILAVADSFDTITGPRLYRRSRMTVEEGVEDISRRAGHWYDPNVVDALRALNGMPPLELQERPEMPWRWTTWRLLRSNAGFARLLAAIGISALGDPLTQVAALVSIFAATNDDPKAVAVGLIAQALGTVVMSGTLGGMVDRLPRRGLVVTLECSRAALLLATPFLARASVWLIVPVLFVLAAINAIIEPARQASIPVLVPAGQTGRANAIVGVVTNAAGAIGFAVAGAVLALAQLPMVHSAIVSANLANPANVLFVADALAFALAALLVLSIKSLGGGAPMARVTGSMRRAWQLQAVKPHLVIAALAAFLIAISYPALLALAYRVSPTRGGPTYSALEVVVLVGLLLGSLVVTRARAIGTIRTAGAGLLITGVFSLAMTLTPSSIVLVASALLIASIGNPIYTVANKTALLEAADSGSRGSVMATRFTVVQAATIGGTALGGVLAQLSPFAAYGFLAVGLILLGMFAMAAGRQQSNRLLGRVYEEANLLTAGAPTQADSALGS